MTSRRRIQRILRNEGDSGAAMVLVLATMVLLGVVSVTIVAATVFNTNVTSETRVSVRAQAAADAGLDRALAALEGKKYNELYQVCGETVTVDTIPVVVSTSYALTTGATVACPTSSQGTQVARVVVTSRAAAVDPVGGNTVARTSVIELLPIPRTVTLDKALFGESSFTITNDTVITGSAPGARDAHVYSNGGVNCRTQIPLDGSIYAAQGNIRLENNCKINNSVWASGTVFVENGSTVNGDVYAAAPASTPDWTVRLQNGAIVTGNVLTNGTVLVENPPASGYTYNVAKSIFSYGGMVDLDSNGPDVGGSVYSNGAITMGQGTIINVDAVSRTAGVSAANTGNRINGVARVATNFTPATNGTGLTVGTRQVVPSGPAFPAATNPAAAFPAAVGFPSQIQPPVREQFPVVLGGSTAAEQAAQYAMWTADGWDIKTVTGQCSNSQVTSAISAQQSGSARTMVIFAGCPSGISVDNANISLKHDLAIVSTTGMLFNNETRFSTVGGVQRDLYLIVPAHSAGVTWSPIVGGQTHPSCSPSRDIVMKKMDTGNTRMMVYTPCTFLWENGMLNSSDVFTGQIYAGGMDIRVGIKLQMATVPVPSLSAATPNPSAEAKMNLISRYDVPS